MDTLLSNLRAALGRDAVISEPDELLVYECDGLTHYRERPRAVVFPRSTEEVSEALRVLARERVPFAPRGAGTGLSGGALALNRGVTIELAKMRRLIKLDVENRLAVVETGMVNAQLSRAVAQEKLYYAPDPSSQASCTIGGNIAENAGGIHCLKYGMTTDHVLGARVVLSDGQIIELGGAARTGAGYDLLGIFIGSEGTFGIATEATLRLLPIPPAVRTMLADFTDIDDASRAVSAIIAAGIIPAALEMVDGATIRAVEASVFAAGLPLDAAGALLVELDGLEAGIDVETARVQSICLAHGARHCRLAADEGERKKLWAARKGAFGAMGRVAPDMLIQDAVVPRSRLPEVLAATYRISAKYRLRIANVFHAGDGNLHPFISFDSRDADEVLRVQEAGREIMETCVRAGGTITGEHGVGLDKSAYLPLIFSDDALRAMLKVRAAFDPDGLCNPGKVIPVLKGCGESRAALPRHGDTKRAQVVNADAAAMPISTPSIQLITQHTHGSIASEQKVFRLSSHAQIFHSLASIVGQEHVEESIDGGKSFNVSPASTDETCEVLKLANVESLKVIPAGSATWLDAGDILDGQVSEASGGNPSIILRTTRLSRIIEHEPADLVATVEAGCALADFNREVGRAQQWLALDPPGDGHALTLGGIAATGLGGAQSFGYGKPRAHVLGMTIALAGGTLIRAGGRVVKNVAGYDLCKLFVGSYGTLGVIHDLTFKLRPRPDVEATLIALCVEAEPLISAARTLVAASLLPVAIELLSPETAAALELPGEREKHVLLARFAGTNESVADQTMRAREILWRHVQQATVEIIADDTRLWTALASQALGREEKIVWRACVRPGDLGLLLAEVKKRFAGNEAYRWQASAGSGQLRFFDPANEDDADSIAAQILRLQRLREFARNAGGSLIIERAPDSLKRALGAWGLDAPTISLMRRVKQQLDPGDVFSPGRFGDAQKS